MLQSFLRLIAEKLRQTRCQGSGTARYRRDCNLASGFSPEDSKRDTKNQGYPTEDGEDHAHVECPPSLSQPKSVVIDKKLVIHRLAGLHLDLGGLHLDVALGVIRLARRGVVIRWRLPPLAH